MKLLYIYFVTFNLYLFGYLMAETKQVFIDPHAMFDESDIKVEKYQFYVRFIFYETLPTYKY